MNSGNNLITPLDNCLGNRPESFRHSEPEDRLLIVFSKNPVAGQVKTRLACSIGNEKALEIYEALREHTARTVPAVRAKLAVYYSGFIPGSDIFLSPGTEARLQHGGDLGERMHNAISEGLSCGFRFVVLIGTDCPDISAGILEKAFLCLENLDAVLGPAKDGGFYLVGLKRSIPELFHQRVWSTGTVLAETIRRLEAAGASFSLLPELQDIDTLEDLQQSSFRIDGTETSPSG